MAVKDEGIEVITLRIPKRFGDALRRLATFHGTDLTGYLNAVVISDHIYKNPTNARILNPDAPDKGKHE